MTFKALGHQSNKEQWCLRRASNVWLSLFIILWEILSCSTERELSGQSGIEMKLSQSEGQSSWGRVLERLLHKERDPETWGSTEVSLVYLAEYRSVHARVEPPERPRKEDLSNSAWNHTEPAVSVCFYQPDWKTPWWECQVGPHLRILASVERDMALRWNTTPSLPYVELWKQDLAYFM